MSLISLLDKSVIEPAVASASSTEADIATLFDKCLARKKVPILFSVEDEPYCTSFAKSSVHLPLALLSVFDPAHLENDYLQLVEEGQNMPGLLDVTPLQQKNLEEARSWMRCHAGTITASCLYQSVHIDPHKPAVLLIYGICYPETTKFTTQATRYGCKHECLLLPSSITSRISALFQKNLLWCITRLILRVCML